MSSRFSTQSYNFITPAAYYKVNSSCVLLQVTEANEVPISSYIWFELTTFNQFKNL